VDDIIDSGQTLCHAASVLARSGAQEWEVFVTHVLLKGVYSFQKDIWKKGVVTDTLPLKEECSVIHQVTVAPVIGALFNNLK
jgi:ribose-phosphate pyrophosphokinase